MKKNISLKLFSIFFLHFISVLDFSGARLKRTNREARNGGISGAILTGVFATSAINPIFKDADGNALPVGLSDGNAMQIVNQLAGIGISVALGMVGTLVILKFVDLVIGLRVSETEETAGLDATRHGETAYVFEGKLIHLSGENAAFAKADEPGEIISANLALDAK